jgi:hypothetical protein
VVIAAYNPLVLRANLAAVLAFLAGWLGIMYLCEIPGLCTNHEGSGLVMFGLLFLTNFAVSLVVFEFLKPTRPARK